MMRAVTIAIALGAVMACAGCQTAPAPAIESVNSSSVASSYKLGTGDKIRVITFGEQSLSGEFSVNELGHVSLPLVGEISAGGLTLDQFRSEVVKALSDGFVKNPRVSIEVLNYRPFYILGEIAKPGEYPFSSGLTVTNAVATAGGFTYRANLKKVYIRGQAETREHQAPLTSLTLVHPGDTIRIAERLF